MGIDAWVGCSCIKDGIAAPHPLPQLLRFQETGEPPLDVSAEPSLEQWLQHDRWLKTACSHGRRLVSKRLGNIALIDYIREYVESLPQGDLRMIRERVIYDGTHCGDWVFASDSARLLEEARNLRERTTDPSIGHFADALIELAQASATTGNPIVF